MGTVLEACSAVREKGLTIGCQFENKLLAWTAISDCLSQETLYA